AEHIGRQQLNALVQFALVHLADGARRSGRASRLQPGAHALVGPLPDAFFAVHPHESLPQPRIGPPTTELRLADHPHAPGSADAVDAARTRAGHHLALAGQRRVGHPPPIADIADALTVRHAYAIEE